MIESLLIVVGLLLAAHFLGDFVLQTHWQASNKSKRLDALLKHIASYTLCMYVCMVPVLGFKDDVIVWALINGGLHLFTDYFTSRATAYFWQTERWHDFFVMVGFDQLIHYACLLFTFWWVFLT